MAPQYDSQWCVSYPGRLPLSVLAPSYQNAFGSTPLTCPQPPIRPGQLTGSAKQANEVQQRPVINCRFCPAKIVRLRGLCDYPNMGGMGEMKRPFFVVKLQQCSLVPLKEQEGNGPLGERAESHATLGQPFWTI